MIDLIRQIFFENWFRKLISLFVAIIIWFVVHDSITGPSKPTSSELSLFKQKTFFNAT